MLVIIVTFSETTLEVNIMTNPSAQFDERIAAVLAARVRQLRDQLGLTQDALASRSGLSKGTVVALEQGKANPSIGVLCKLAAALGQSVSDLIAEAEPLSIEPVITVTTPSLLWTSSAGGRGLIEASLSGPVMFELWSWTLMPGDEHLSDSHSPGTWELISVRRGSLAISVGEDQVVLEEGQAARLRTDRPHSYRALGPGPADFTMAVLE
jgi:transcriptional regulator with XRE-family HTH domain